MRRWQERKVPAEFSHSLETQIGGQTRAGFAIEDLYEDNWSDEATPLNRFSPTYIATLAIKAKDAPTPTANAYLRESR